MKQPLALLALAVAAATAPALAQTQIAAAGTQFEAKLDQTLSSKTLRDGDTFTLTEHDGFFHKAPAGLKGAKIDGHVENVAPARMGHGATMNVIFDDVVLADGTRAPVAAKVSSSKEFEAKHHYFRDAGLVVGSAVVGHMAAKRTGLKHGGLAGAAAGFALATNLKSDIVVKRGSIVHLTLTQPLVAQPAS